MKTQEEILEKIKLGMITDKLGFGTIDLYKALDYKNMMSLIDPSDSRMMIYILSEEIWEETRLKSKEDIIDKIKYYLSQDEYKIVNDIGPSEDKNYPLYITWFWLIDEDFYNELIDTYMNNYGHHGINVFNKISDKLKSMEEE